MHIVLEGDEREVDGLRFSTKVGQQEVTLFT